jgi:hypothetical protein
LWRHDAWVYGQTPGKFNNKYSGGTPFIHELGGRVKWFIQGGDPPHYVTHYLSLDRKFL